MCPFATNRCGQDTSNIEIANIGDEVIITPDFFSGETCFFEVTTKCGILAIDLITYGQESTFFYEYIDFDPDDLARGTQEDHPWTGGAPASGMPFRSETFNYEDKNVV